MTPKLGRQRQEDCEFVIICGDIERPCLKKQAVKSQIWWGTPVIPALWRCRQMGQEFKSASDTLSSRPAWAT